MDTSSCGRNLLGRTLQTSCAATRKLIVEVDGATHSEDHQVAYDARRTEFLRQQGFRVLRIFSTDVFTSMSNVLDMILLALDGKIETG